MERRIADYLQKVVLWHGDAGWEQLGQLFDTGVGNCSALLVRVFFECFERRLQSSTGVEQRRFAKVIDLPDIRCNFL